MNVATRIMLAACFSTFCLLGTAIIETETHEEFGLRFWKALSSANIDKLEEMYAESVLLLAGSELLKKEWGINPIGDRKKDLALKRQDLLNGYKAIIGKVGKDKWKKVLSEIKKDKISFEVAGKDSQVFNRVKKSDVIMKIAIGPGDDTLFFVMRQDEKKKWLVVMEATDY